MNGGVIMLQIHSCLSGCDCESKDHILGSAKHLCRQEIEGVFTYGMQVELDMLREQLQSEH